MNGKKETMPRLHDGIHADSERPFKEAHVASLGGTTIPTTKEQAPPKQKEKVREPHELQEEAWRLMNDAVSTGQMVLSNGITITLNADSLIRVIQWLASSKAKKPHLIDVPEDFNLKETTSGK